MTIGIPTEVKDHEYRVALTPAGARALSDAGHQVLVQAGAGLGSGLPDEAYVVAGARIVPSADDAWAADLVCKIKEPVASEYRQLRRDQVLFTYLHLAASRACTQALIDAGTTSIAYETVQPADGSLPLLAPMSEVAGRLATQAGAHHLLRSEGGRGVLLGGVPGAAPGRVVVLGAGTAGRHATEMAVGLHAEVTVLDVSLPRLRELDARYGGRVRTLASTAHAIEEAVTDADLVIGAVLVPGARAPILVDTATVARMRPGSVLVDVSVDQGGCFAGTRPTTYSDPTFPVHGSLLYCVANMPGAVPVTSTRALTAATLPYLVALAAHGWRAATRGDAALARGLNTHDGAVLHEGVAAAHGLRRSEPAEVLA
jgi:alanine dehydrogenase